MLQSPAGGQTRPTAAKARMALFNRLYHGAFGASLENARVLDMFAGTGAIGLEALSWGAKEAIFVEADRAALAALRANITALSCHGQTRVLAGDATKMAGANIGVVDIIFLDPPYRKDLVVKALKSLPASIIGDHTIAIAETAHNEILPEIAGWTLEDTRTYGAAATHIFTRSSATIDDFLA